MKKLLLVPALCGLLHLSCGTVDPATSQNDSFIVVHGGARDDEGWSVIETSDGGYMLLGTTESFGRGGKDFYLVKTDRSGVEQWSRTYGDEKDDLGQCVRQTSDGGYVMVGSTDFPAAGSSDILLVKIDRSGDTLWTRRFGGSATDLATTVDETADGGLIICGTTQSFGAISSDFWLVRTDGAGVKIWDQIIPGGSEEECSDVVATADGGFLAIGVANPRSNAVQINIGRVDASGTELGTLRKIVSGPSSAFDIIALRGGGFMCVGHSRFTHDSAIDSLHFTRLDSGGQRKLITWGLDGTRSFGRRGGNRGHSLVQTRDGGFAALGYTRAFSEGRSDYYLVKIDEGGRLLWESAFGGDGEDIGRSLVETSDGGFIMLGKTESFISGENGSDMMLVKVGPDGKLAP
jgi:hypothetical protein